MDKKLEEALIQSSQMHYRAFQEFMKLTGGQIGLSLQLASSWTAAMLKAGTSEEKEKAARFWSMFDGETGTVS